MNFAIAFSLLRAFEANVDLLDSKNYSQRCDALDILEFEVLQRVEEEIRQRHAAAEGLELKRRAENLKRKWDGVDRDLFSRLRKTLRNAAIPEKIFPGMVEEYVGFSRDVQDAAEGYDALDAFLNGLLHPESLPQETREREAGMVHFQKTPARWIAEMVNRARLGSNNLFIDLGSGLGQAVLLVRLLSGAKSIGVEFEPAYCAYAEKCAADLNLSRVEFLHADARHWDYSQPAVYYMYTPFEGTMLESVLEKMRLTARGPFRLFTFGPCTVEVSRQSWLRSVPIEGKLGEFESIC